MSFLFGPKKAKSPADLVKQTSESLKCYAKSNEKQQAKATEHISGALAAMKVILYGDNNTEPSADLTNQLAQEVYSYDLISALISNLDRLEFEAKKDVAYIFNNLLRRQVGTRFPTVEYITTNPHILDDLSIGYKNPDIALNCGSMLRETVKHEPLARLVLLGDKFWDFFEYVEVSIFDIASDAFATFKELLTRHKTLAADFLENNYDRVFGHYVSLLNSANYVTRRQSLKLLGELLLDRANFNIMTKYISDPENLKLMMNLLRDKRRSIQFEAFHVFKVFVANPNKTPPILDILLRNKSRLISFLSNFQNDNEEEQFNDEKAFLLKQIQQLQPQEE
eukprot:TRINITY_DN16943_c0_g1_i1.p1 TRINITY_DN16943_c0_g1~~TRINITY_DN16943_c0_g1_i1.p1  ORF type:complete len:337 (+),score=91.58 TRINITY_DN16943_c0_g1_i1:266-1276(+)